MKHIICLLLFCNLSLFAQKEITHNFTIDNDVHTLFFNLNDVFQVTIHTIQQQHIKITARSEGEYANYFVLDEIQEGETFTITGDISFIFPDFQDKLSAHKVHAISVDVWLPKNLQVVLQSDIANVSISGNFESFRADLSSGNCFLTQISGKITASSVSGNIVLYANAGNLITETNIGTISKIKLTAGASSYVLKTNKGDITVKHL